MGQSAQHAAAMLDGWPLIVGGVARNIGWVACEGNPSRLRLMPQHVQGEFNEESLRSDRRPGGVLYSLGHRVGTTTAPQNRVLIVVGPSTHPPGTHEVAAGGRLMKHCLENMTNVPGVKAEVLDQWPSDPAALDGVATVVFIGDIFPPMRLPDSQGILAQLDAMMKRGCGIVCVHYATGLRAQMWATTARIRCWAGWRLLRHRVQASQVRRPDLFAGHHHTAAPEHPVSRVARVHV